jgi:hypothetical protein
MDWIREYFSTAFITISGLDYRKPALSEVEGEGR